LRRIATAPWTGYPVYALVSFEVHDEMYEAIQREKRLKKWNRAWKIRLIEEMNPEWKDLSSQFGSSLDDLIISPNTMKRRRS
jgi:predicted GIY-YIG superfamily endonuclease